MVKPQLGHDQVVSELRWSLNTGGHKSRFHCTSKLRLQEVRRHLHSCSTSQFL